MGRSSAVMIVGVRLLVLWAVEVLALWLLAHSLTGLHLAGWRSAVVGVALIGVMNALLRPFLLLITLPFTVLTLGFLTLVINTTVFYIAAELLPGLHASFGTSFVATLVLAIANTTASTLCGFHEEDSIYRFVMRRVVRPFRASDVPARPGLIFVEIDGLAISTLERALQDGRLPTLRRLIQDGTHQLTQWECGLPSQTSSVQAGVLFGNNFDIPGFRWFDKSTGRMVLSSDPADLTRIEQRVSRGAGLLREGGVSICNMFTGDAKRCVATLSTLNPGEQVRQSSTIYFPYFVYPYNFTRTLMLIVAELVIERWEGLRQRLRNESPRVSRGGKFPLLRAASTVFHRELGTYALMSEMFAGVPIAYITYIGYDVVAHHAGPGRGDALRILPGIDRRVAILERCAKEAPRPYHFVFLSDHGQSPSVPFRQRYGKGIEAVVRELISGGGTVRTPPVRTEGSVHLKSLLAEALGHDRLSARAAHRILRARARTRRSARGAVESMPASDVLVCPSGNLGHIYFTTEPRRLDLEDLAAGHPGLIEGLVAHPGIGFAMVRSALHGPVVTGRGGLHYLRDHRVDGDDPLAEYGEGAREQLMRLDAFPNCGDIVLMGRYDSRTGGVETFEEMVGAHGGLGGAQGAPFLLAPKGWPLPNDLIDSPEHLHQLFVRWRDTLARGHVPGTRVDEPRRDAL